MAKVRKLDKLPKRKVTIDDILDRGEIAAAVADTVEAAPNMDEFFAIYVQGDEICWRHSGLRTSRLVYLLELVKKAILEAE